MSARVELTAMFAPFLSGTTLEEAVDEAYALMLNEAAHEVIRAGNRIRGKGYIDTATHYDQAAQHLFDMAASSARTAGDEQPETERLRNELDSYKDELESLHRHTLPQLRREIQHHQDGKKRWRDRAEKAEGERDDLKARLFEASMAKVWTNEDGKKFVFVEDLTGPLLGITPKAGERS